MNGIGENSHAVSGETVGSSVAGGCSTGQHCGKSLEREAGQLEKGFLNTFRGRGVPPAAEGRMVETEDKETRKPCRSPTLQEWRGGWVLRSV